MTFADFRKYLLQRRDVFIKILMLAALIVALIQILRIVSCLGIFSDIVLSPAIFSVFCAIPLLIVVRSRRFSVNVVLLLFCFVSVLSLIFNDPVNNYMSVLHIGLFISMLCLVSPLIENAAFNIFRDYLWRYTLLMCQVVVLLTLVVYVLAELFFGGGSIFILISDPIMLGIVSAFVGLALSFKLLNDDGGNRMRLLFNSVSLAVALVVMIWSGARSAILGFIVGEIYIFVTMSSRLKARRVVLLTVAAAVVLSTFVCKEMTSRIELKFEIGKENNSVIFSRKQLWMSRLEEFCESPIIGIGFTNVSRYSTLYSNEKVTNKCPLREEEPGSSWLSVLSNTGVIGFAVMAWWNVMLLLKVRRRRLSGDNVAVKYGAMLLCFLVVGCFEGWVLYAGSFLFFLYWLLTSRISDSCQRAIKKGVE